MTAFDPMPTSLGAALFPPAAIPLVSPTKSASGAAFGRQVAPRGTARQGCDRNCKGAGKKAPEDKASRKQQLSILGTRYTAIHGHLFLSDIDREQYG
jgi:hypothetical protein